jgi:ketosteroid isomerase-like protein
MPNPKYAAYEPDDPYFVLVRGALGHLVDGEHFFDIVTDDVVYEVLYDFPGWPRVIQGRAAPMAQFMGYVDNITLQSADNAKYNNRFCSIIKIENRKIAHWRDYMDSLAAWNALTAHQS